MPSVSPSPPPTPEEGGPDDGGPGDGGPGDGGPGDGGPGDVGPGDVGPGDVGPGDGGPGHGARTTPPSPIARGPVLRRLAGILLGFVLGLALADLAVGRWDASSDLSVEGMLMWDPALSWVNRPGFENERTRISSLGLRSPEIPAGAPPDEVRVLGVGASRTFGAGQDGPDMFETWSHYLEERADAELDGSWRVLNGGVMGYSMRQSVRRAIGLLDAVDPDLVLVFTSPGAQLMLDPSAARHMIQLPSGRRIPSDLGRALPTALHEPAARLHEALLAHSSIYRRYRARFQDTGTESEAFRKFVLSDAERPERVQAMLDETLDEFEILVALCAERGIALRAVVMLEAFQDSPPRWDEYLQRNAALGAPPLGTPRTLPTELLASELEARGARTWSLTEVVTLFGTDLARFTCDNSHWSALGHELVARSLFHSLRSEALDEALLAARRASPR